MSTALGIGESFDAIVLAGGRGSRLGGADKAAIEIEGERLIDRVAAAARAAGAHRTIIVGPDHTGSLADRVIREDPPFSGPLQAVAAGLNEVESPFVMLLACDLVHPAEVVQQLSVPSAPDADGLILVDEDGRSQWLASCLRTRSLRDAIHKFTSSGQSLANRPLKVVFKLLDLEQVEALNGTTLDIDTPEQLAHARSQERTQP
ncbi:molybdenum cofactor guanylyltransferase [Leucobacter denitrificans]|uniref:NTP transferase domain-containing protein n=1 Tax=Leucobacter denitrificans TaxID=683042 RepID=A0A7G9S419_9MICO|nr:NTP transferase domain-containing protein [Leucobacter denitrificans]QNN62594.1 NTP transferase domain-containing protein [Leucobacter denitrificans]